MGKPNPDDEKKTKNARKRYEKPTATKLTAEQAKLKLLGHAGRGDQGAKDLLEVFPKASQKDSEAKKKTA